MRSLFIAVICLSVGLLCAELSLPFIDDFSGEDPGWSEVIVLPASVAENNHQIERNVTTAEIQSLDGDFEVPEGSSGEFLVMEVNAYDGVTQVVAYVLEAGDANNIYVEWRKMVWIEPGWTAATSEFAGVAVRSSDMLPEVGADAGFMDDGYMLRVRTDYSGSFGSYAGLKKVVDNARQNPPLGKWILFEEGSDGEGVHWDSTLININPDPQGDPIRVTNLWVTYRIELVGNQVRYFINDELVFVISDSEFDAGKIQLFMWDQWASTTDAHNKVLTIVDYIEVDEWVEPTSASSWMLFQ